MTEKEALAFLFHSLLQAFTPSLHEPPQFQGRIRLFGAMHRALLDLIPAVHGACPNGCLPILCHTCRMRYATWDENDLFDDRFCPPCREAARQEQVQTAQAVTP